MMESRYNAFFFSKLSTKDIIQLSRKWELWGLTHIHLKKMAAISQATFRDVFSWI